MDFEEAITVCGGYGRYQMKLFIVLIPVAFTFVFGVSSASYVMPPAVCELEISKYKQGILYSAIYLGMVPSGAIWGAISDVIGRRKTLLVTCAIAGVFEFLGSFSFHYWFLFGCKFLAGCATAGAHLTFYVYLSEFTDKKNKDTITMLSGATAGLGYFMQPGLYLIPTIVLAYFLIPLKFRWVIIEKYLDFPSWKIFLMISSLPPIMGFFVSLLYIDETPKFLILTDRKEESLRVLKDIYVENSGNSPDTFPVKDIVLREGTEDTKKNTQEGFFSKSMRQIKPLFRYPYLVPALMSFAAQIISMGAYNAIRSYIPILFSLALGFGQTEKLTNAEWTPFCTLFQTQNVFKSKVECHDAQVDIDPRIYIGSIIVGLCVFFSFFLFKSVVNMLGKVTTFWLTHLLSAICIFLFPFSVSIFGLIIICIYGLCMQNALTIAIGLMISRTPTTMRGISVSLVMVFGRIGVILGNQLLPIISNISCKAGFWAIAVINLMAIPIMFVYSRQPNPLEDSTAKVSGALDQSTSTTSTPKP